MGYRDFEAFNPRSRTGSDIFLLPFVYVHRFFQSTLPHGERFGTASDVSSFTILSIHAPARGAMRSKRVLQAPFFSFNPRSRTGSDLSGESIMVTITGFQSTLPHGERLGRLRMFPVLPFFQSTLPHGERCARKSTILVMEVFQSTLPHGERY